MGGYGALNAPTCDGGAVVCGRSGYPSPPPSQSPSPPPTPTPPPSPPYVSPPSTPPSCASSDNLIQDRAGLVAAMNLWCSNVDTTTLADGVANNAKNVGAKCAPSTWNVKMAAGTTLGPNPTGGLSVFAEANLCTLTDWGKVAGDDDMNGWDVREVTSMKGLFEGAAKFNEPLNAWDVGKVTDLNTMFKGAALFNQDVGAWNVGKVTDMESMFDGAAVFSQSLNAWNTAEVTTVKNMFKDAAVFKQNLNDWKLGAVTDTAGMFSGATAFNAPVNSWDVSKVADISTMFLTAAAFNQDISAWDVGAIITAGNAADAKVQAAFFGTGLSDCNKKAVYNHFTSQTTAADFFTLGGGNDADATEDALGANGADWSALC